MKKYGLLESYEGYLGGSMSGECFMYHNTKQPIVVYRGNRF